MVEKANKRELILAAAREIFGEKGYHTATSEEIAKRAGVGKGTIYQYFDSKQEIFTEMHMLYLKQYSENVTALIHEEESFEQNLRRLAHFHIEHLHELAQYGVQMLSDIHPATISCEEGHALMENLKKQLGIEQFWFIEKAKQRGEIREIVAGRGGGAVRAGGGRGGHKLHTGRRRCRGVYDPAGSRFPVSRRPALSCPDGA